MTFTKEIKVNADDTATPTYSSELFSVTKADGSIVVGQQQGDIITVPTAGLNNQDWIGTITKVRIINNRTFSSEDKLLNSES